MIIAGVIYYRSGGIHRAKSEPESIWPGSRQEERLPRYAADLESEMIHIRRRLEMYHKKEKEYRIEGIVGIFLVLIGGYIPFGLHALGLVNWVGLAFLIYAMVSSKYGHGFFIQKIGSRGKLPEYSISRPCRISGRAMNDSCTNWSRRRRIGSRNRFEEMSVKIIFLIFHALHKNGECDMLYITQCVEVRKYGYGKQNN